MWRKRTLIWLTGVCVALIPELTLAEQDARNVADVLRAMDVWILTQPKCVESFPGTSCDLAACTGLVASKGEGIEECLAWPLQRLADTSGVRLPILESAQEPVVAVVLAETPGAFPAELKMDDTMFARMGEQGYGLVIGAGNVTLAARTRNGLRYGLTTLAQIAADRTVLPGMAILDWPSLQYRGVQQDVSRGQVPAPETMKRLASVLAEGKMNVLEFYLEHVYKYRAFPDISPPEGYTPEEVSDFGRYAAGLGIEAHPLLQGLGHAFHILGKPQYQHLRIGPAAEMPWIMTFDIRKPEAVQMVVTMIEELCETCPGELFNVDITEIDTDGLEADGLSLDEITDLVFGYVLKLHDTVKKHGRRLMITQGPLDSRGHLSGMGPNLAALPKDIVIGSYYCAGGPYQPAWEKDFPRLHENGLDFFAQAWIYSHLWLTPWVARAAEFSDLEISRGLQHGAMGSITCDWGDAGHFHFVGQEWLPYLYHGACAWSGAHFDRDYFRQACARVLYGVNNDTVIRAIEGASNVNAQAVPVRDKDGNETSVATTYIWEFVHDPFTHPDITRLADPAGAGQRLLDIAVPALAALLEELPKARRNKDNIEQWIFGARCYIALGHKLVALGHYNDARVPRRQVIDELEAVAAEFETLQNEFKRLWLAENRENDGYEELVRRFTYTILPCRLKAKELQAP
ncbi:MAG: hypothetical protein KA184_04045 [Candidatus Hydrogenedentes bacterium]|nr:hypothetical protein [Candidatus Hydrogenedentota bacterium]